MDFTKLLFKPRTPEGFRLATFEETTKKYSLLRTRHILNGSEKLRLFDSVLCDGKETTFDGDSWPHYMVVVPETSTRRRFSFLRKELYSGAKLSDERKKIALGLSCLLEDIEAIYCLLMCDSCEAKSKLKDHFHKNIESEMKKFSPNFLIIVKILFGSLEIGDAESYTKSLDYVLSRDNGVPENAIAIAEIVLDKIRQPESSPAVEHTVHSLIQTVATKHLKEDAEAKRIGILTKLLSEYIKLLPLVFLDDVIQPKFKEILIEAIRRDYEKLVDDLLHLNYERDLLDDLLSSQDSKSKKDEVDTLGDNLLHCAARGAYGENIVKVLGKKCEQFINLRNQKGLTPLHVAAMHDKKALITSLNSCLPLVVKEALKATDYTGRIPLHLAASEGTEETVKVFLEMGSDPFKRDIGGKTAVHHAVENQNDNETAKKKVEVLLSHLKCNKKRALLLSISAAGTGTAEQIEGLDADIKEFLKEKKVENFSGGVNLLEEAAGSKNSRLTWEFLNRSANVQSLVQDKEAFTFVKKVIEKFSEQSTDQPTLVDTLGRNVLAECISAHFLNPYIKSPITVSISGGSGSGKTSLLQQIESYLLITAAQLAFPYLWWNPEKFDDWTKKDYSSKGKYMYRKIEDGVFNLLEKGNYRDFKEEVKTSSLQEKRKRSVVYLLKAYIRDHKEVYKSLACMDFRQLIDKDENDSVYKSQGQSLGAVPRVLTVNFNASSYRGRTEAWAGLAVEITKEIEASMTWAQLMSTRWRNSWSRHSQDFYFGFIFPVVMLAFVGGWVAWAAWKLLDRAGSSEIKHLKYGSVAATVITIVWYVLFQVVSVFKPISTQMTGYFSLPDYSQQLGYQQKVISDIKFLKKEIGKKPCFVFSFLAGEMCKSWWGLWKENIEGTSVPDYGSAPEDKLRIIAFVDDLDQCEDTVILRVLWAINLVFRVCEINVILTMDKATIQAAYKKSSSAQDRDFVDNFISKIVQLPVSIPDPKDEHWVQFLDTELLRDFEEHMDSVEQPYNTQSEIESASENREQEGDTLKDIESGKRAIKWEGCCITFVYDWLTPRGKGIQKLPREWKNFMNYHKFARNVISRMATLPDMRPNTVGWQVEFVVWTFVCSQWKHQINHLIQDWYEIAYEQDGDGYAKLKSSLQQIVADHIRLLKWEEQRACQVGFRVEEQLGEGTGKQVFIVSNSEELSSVGSVKKELESWENLYTCLNNVHDVSIESIR